MKSVADAGDRIGQTSEVNYKDTKHEGRTNHRTLGIAVQSFREACV